MKSLCLERQLPCISPWASQTSYLKQKIQNDRCIAEKYESYNATLAVVINGVSQLITRSILWRIFWRLEHPVSFNLLLFSFPQIWKS